MQKCSLCGGRVVNGRCEDCGLPIPPEHSYTLRGESAHYHRVNGEDVLHRVRPAGNRPKVEGYDDEERTAHVHESGTDRHNAPRPAVRTARVEHHIEAPSRRRRSTNVAWLIIVVALFLILPMLQVLLQREIGSSVSKPVPEFSEEQAIEADSNAYDAADSGLDDVPLPAGTVLFLAGNNALYFHSSNAQVDDLSTDTAPNPVTDDISYTLSDSEDSLYLLVGEDIEPGVYDVTCTAGSGYFAFDLPMENTRTMYCSAWLYGDDTYQDTLHHIVLAEGTELILSNYNDMGYTVMFQPSETVYTHE